MSHSMPNVLVLQLAIADYRDAFVDLLSATIPSLKVQMGMEYFDRSTRSSQVVASKGCVQIVGNRYLFGRRLAWQKLRWRQVVDADVVIIELNPRIVSNWGVLLLRALFRKRTLLWGHVWSRAGADSPTEYLRRVMRASGDGVILYTETQRRELIGRYGARAPTAFVAPNALYRSEEMQVSVGEARDFIYVGRLVSQKKVLLLVMAFAMFVEDEPSAVLHIVGDGEERERLDAYIREHSVPNVVFHGHVSDLNRLREIYRGCVASVSPGYVGLSITQSFSVGVPMIIATDEPHSPELECARDSENATFFASNSPRDLCVEMRRWYEARGEHAVRAHTIVSDCRGRYSVERMVDGFVEAIQHG